MKKHLLILIILLIPCYLSGQNDSILKAIMNYDNSKPVIISKARSLLLDEFLKDDFIKVKEVKDYLISKVANDDYAVFYPFEHWLILYWTREYDELITVINQTDSLELASFQKKIKPANDMLFEKIRDRSRESRTFLIGSVNDSELNAMDKDIVIMNLSYLLAGDDYPEINQNYLNELADDFLSKYPDSEYEEFTRKYIRFRYKASNWGMSAEFFTGYGIYTGNLSEAFNNNVPIGVAFDILYKRFTLFLRDYIGFSKTKRDILYSLGTWAKGSRAETFLPEASLGYAVADNKTIKMTPFIGIAATDIGPTPYDQQQDPDLEDADIHTATYTFGLNLDFKLGTSRTPMMTIRGPEQNYWFIRLRYSYSFPQFNKKYDGFGGNIHCITIGVGGSARRMKRNY